MTEAQKKSLEDAEELQKDVSEFLSNLKFKASEKRLNEVSEIDIAKVLSKSVLAQDRLEKIRLLGLPD